MRTNPFTPPATPSQTPAVVVPPTIPVQTLLVPEPPPIPQLKPTDLANCVGWLETHADGSIVNRLEYVTKRKQTLIVTSDSKNPELGCFLLFDRELSDAELQAMTAYATGS